MTLDAERAQEVERVAQPEGDAFEHGAHERSSIVAELQAGECAARVGVGVRRPLALQVREEEKSLDARLPALGLGHEAVERDVRCDRVVEPLQRARGREHHAHRVPRAGNRVAEDVHPGPLVRAVVGQRGEDDTRGAEHERGRPGPVDPDAERRGGAVAGARRDGMPLDVSPETAGDSSAGGSHRAGISSASSTSSLQRRPATSRRSVPEASATSIAHEPVSRRRT